MAEGRGGHASFRRQMVSWLVMIDACKRAVIWGAFAVLALSAFPAQAASLPRLRVSDNGRFFVKADGSPFFYLGDTEWALFHLSREDAELYLKDRAAKKFTVIQAIATFWGGLDGPNAFGIYRTVSEDGVPGIHAAIQRTWKRLGSGNRRRREELPSPRRERQVK